MGYIDFVKNKNREKDMQTVAMTKAAQNSQSKQIWRQYKKNTGAVMGLITLCVFVVIAIAASFIWDYDTDIAGMNIEDRLLKPSMEHLFGTDHMGRDVLARVFYGTRYSLLIGFGSTLISTVFGIFFEHESKTECPPNQTIPKGNT